MRNAFRDYLTEAKSLNSKIQLLVSDIGFGVFENYKDLYPDDYYNLGIAESNIIGVSSGLASLGFIPFVYTIVPFLIMRPYEQIRIDLAMQKKRVVLVGVGGGLAYGNLGPTHHSFEDVGLAMSLPNMNVYCPSEPADIPDILKEVLEHPGPSYIRLGKNGEKQLFNVKKSYQNAFIDMYGNLESENLVISTGPIAYEVYKLIAEGCTNLCLLKITRLKPLDMTLLEVLKSYKNIYILEEHTTEVGFGNKIAKLILENSIKIEKFTHLGIKDIFNELVGSRDFLLQKNKLDSESLKKVL